MRAGYLIVFAGVSCCVTGLGFAEAAGVSAIISLQEAPFEVHYPQDGAALARYTLDLLREAREDLDGRLSVGSDPIVVILCDTLSGFRMHAGAYARPNVGGIAKPTEGIIVLKTPELLGSQAEFRFVLRHELVHVLLARNTDVARMPLWLNEGIAMTLSGERRWHSVVRVAHMYLQGRLISYRDLDWAFEQPGIETEFGDAYAQSLLMTRYLRDRLGDEGLWRLVAALNHQSFGDALRAHAGWSPLEFYDAWVASLWKVALISSLVSGFTLFQFMAVLALLAYVRKRRVGKRILEEWAADEAADSDSDAATLDSGHAEDGLTGDGEPFLEEDEEYP